ncbi:MAG: hypothetical protein NTV22_04945 [bacterium]|nr:hypothetical protein [bacterium]
MEHAQRGFLPGAWNTHRNKSKRAFLFHENKQAGLGQYVDRTVPTEISVHQPGTKKKKKNTRIAMYQQTDMDATHRARWRNIMGAGTHNRAHLAQQARATTLAEIEGVKACIIELAARMAAVRKCEPRWITPSVATALNDLEWELNDNLLAGFLWQADQVRRNMEKVR